MKSPALLWIGRILSVLPCLAMVASAGMKLAHGPEIVEGLGKYHYPESAILPIGILEISCVILYAVPQTSVLGAALATAYLGGAAATHVQAGEAFIPPVLFAILLWAGLGLREPRLLALMPLRGAANAE